MEGSMDAALGVVRIALGVLFVMTGVMKFVVPNLREAWSRQLQLARLPFHQPTFLLLPVAEIVVGVLLILGVLTRPSALVVILMMLGATYVHLVVHDPSVFPLQPEAPIIPGVVIVLAVFVLIGGAGSWSVA
jgi:uncharacterized membrane protein YphA (DoxX/SURF4 family)